MLTVVIIGIVAAIGVPRYANALTRHKADAAARRIVADIQHAQAHAKATSSDTTLRFRTSIDRVLILEMAHPDDPSESYVTQIAEYPYESDITTAVFDNDKYLIFDGFGRPDSGGTLTVRCGDQIRTITVDQDSGEATIQ